MSTTLLPLDNEDDNARSPNILHAIRILQDGYFTGNLTLEQGIFEIHRLQFHQAFITQEAIPLLQDLSICSVEEKIPAWWLQDTIKKFATLLVQLCEAEKNAQGMCV